MLPLGTDAITVILLQNTALPIDTTLVNYLNLGALLAPGAATEANFTNYSRVSLTSGISIAYTTVSSPTKVTVAFPPQTWNAAGGALNNTISKVVLAYRPTSGSTDASCLVLATQDYSGTTTGGALVVALGTLTDQ